MAILIEVLSCMWQAIYGIVSCIINVVWENLSEILEIKKILGYFTPTGAIALYLGVLTIFVTIVVNLIRKAVRN